jgi:uncharacterized membrane protein
MSMYQQLLVKMVIEQVTHTLRNNIIINPPLYPIFLMRYLSFAIYCIPKFPTTIDTTIIIKNLILNVGVHFEGATSEQESIIQHVTTDLY